MSNVPKLRFKANDGNEFPEYKQLKMKDVFEEVIDKNHPDMNVLSIQQGTGTVLRQESNRNLNYDKANLKNYKAMKPGDFIIHLRSFEGGLEYSNHDGISSPAYKILRTKTLIPDAYKGYFRSSKFIEGKLSAAVVGIRDGKNIDMPTFWNIELNIPSTSEQKKIADFLSTIDEIIAKSRAEVEAWEKRKKGVIKKLFSQEVRFKADDGSEFPKWEEKKIGELGEFIKGAPLSKSDISDTGTPFILYGELYTTYDEVACDIKRKTKAIVNEKHYSKPGDVLIPTSGESAEEISTATCVMVPGVILAGDLNIFRSNILDGRVMSYILNYQSKWKIASIAQGKSIVHIQSKQLSEISVIYPLSKEEQQKIANCLSSIDEVIKKCKKELAAWEELKKGLLQQMFI